MSSDRWWWAQQAQQLRFSQLDVARKQAESWRNGLTGITTLLGAVLILKGRDDVAALAIPVEVTLVVLLGIAMATLVTATLLAIRAASGAPGDECLLTGEDLERWTSGEVRLIHRTIWAAGVLTVTGVVLISTGVGIAWLAPARSSAPPTVQVLSEHGQYCGQLSQLGNGLIAVSERSRKILVPLSSVVSIYTVSSCTSHGR